jgi:hypothetical protein
MHGIPLQKRTEYCFWVTGLMRGNDKANRHCKDACLWFRPPPFLSVNMKDKGYEELKIKVGNIVYLNDSTKSAQWFYAYKGPWTSGEVVPRRGDLYHASDILHVKVKAYKTFNAGPGQVIIIPLQVGGRDGKEYKIMDCDACDGKSQVCVRDQFGKEEYEQFVYEKTCPKCHGLGKIEYIRPLEPWEEYDFVDKNAFDIFQERMRKAIEEYDDEILFKEEKEKYEKFIDRLKDEKKQIAEGGGRKRKRKPTKESSNP